MRAPRAPRQSRVLQAVRLFLVEVDATPRSQMCFEAHDERCEQRASVDPKSFRFGVLTTPPFNSSTIVWLRHTRQQRKIDEIAQIDDAFADVVEMCLERETCEAVDEPLRRDAEQHVLDEAHARDHQQEADDHGQDECDDLVLRRGRDARADCEKRARHESATDVGCNNRPVVGVAQELTVIQIGNVSASAIAVNAQAARNSR